MKHIRIFLILTAALAVLTGCNASVEEQLSEKAVTIALNGQSAETDGSGIHVDGGQITITHHGIYRITGTLEEGQILVDCTDSGEVWLVPDNADITNPAGPCIYIRQADLTHIRLETDTVNRLTDGPLYVLEEGTDEPDAALFARDDLVIQGDGSLVIDAGYKTAIAGKDDVTISGGHIDISSIGHGIKGKDSLTITGGVIAIDAEGDGLKSTNADGVSVGTITITGGVLDIYAEDEGIQTISDITVTGGVIRIDTPNNGIRTDAALHITGGEVSVDAEDTPIEAAETNTAGGLLYIDGVLRMKN